MDAVEMPLPAVSVSKLMGLEGSCGGVGVTVKEVAVASELDQVSFVGRCNISSNKDRTPLIRQKNNLNSKRGDKRNSKASAKTKISRYDSFSVKAGFGNFSSASWGNYVHGIYGLKSDFIDVTKHVDELSLNELMEGSSKCPNLVKMRAKKATTGNETLLHSVQRACSILQYRRPVKSSGFTDKNSSIKSSPCALRSVSSGSTSGDKGDANLTDSLSSNKDSWPKPETLAGRLDFPSHHPKDILDRLALPPSKDVNALLLDASKPASSSRATPDPRVGKPIFCGTCLPSFPWSHTFGGHYKSNAESVKLCTNRNACQGRWARVGNARSFLGIANDCFANLESFTYDHNLIPFVEPKSPTVQEVKALSAYVSVTSCKAALSSSTRSEVGYSPNLLTAARTLYDMASSSSNHKPEGTIMWWPKKTSLKAMKARKLNSNRKPEEVSGIGSLFKCADRAMASKKHKLLMAEKDDQVYYSKDPTHWSAPRSYRPSPSKLLRDGAAGLNSVMVKKSSMMPPPTRVTDKACGSSQEKVGRLMEMDWTRARDKLD